MELDSGSNLGGLSHPARTISGLWEDRRWVKRETRTIRLRAGALKVRAHRERP